MQFMEAVNNRTGARTYYIDGRRVSRDVFEQEKFGRKLDTFHTETRGGLTRHFSHTTATRSTMAKKKSKKKRGSKKKAAKRKAPAKKRKAKKKVGKKRKAKKNPGGSVFSAAGRAGRGDYTHQVTSPSNWK